MKETMVSGAPLAAPGAAMRRIESTGTARHVATPKTIGDRFVIVDVLGKGAMGTVYRAYDTAVGREVAIKLLHAHKQSQALRLVDEGRAMAALSHPNVVRVYQVSVIDSEVVLVMEYVQGQTLADWLTKPREPDEVLAVFAQAGLALAAAHRAGLVHRDFKPANVLVSSEGRVLVTDFGIAHQLSMSSDATGPLDTATVAPAGRQVGTPWYMAPEQHVGLEICPRADQYAFCLALWEALCGASPFSPRADTLWAQKLEGPPAWPKHVLQPKRVTEALRQGLMPHREQRHEDMNALLAAIAPVLPARHGRLLALGAGLSLVTLTAASAFARHAEVAERCTGAHLHLRGTWDPARRQRVRDAFARTGLGYAGQTWTHVRAALDTYTSEWAREFTTACRLTAIDRVQAQSVMDLRIECLHRSRRQLEVLVQVLSQASAQDVQNAVEVVSRLPALHRCSDVEALRSGDPLPDDPEEAAQVERGAELLQRADAFELAGRYTEMAAEVETAAAVLDNIDHASSRVHLNLSKAQVSLRDGNHEAAKRALEETLELAVAQGSWEAIVATSGALAYIVGYLDWRPHEGESLAKLSVALASGQSPELEAQARIKLGTMLYMKDHNVEAESEFRRALALREEQLGTVHPDIAESHNHLGVALNAQGRRAEAEAQHRRALALREELFGSGHPKAAESRNNLGNVLFAQKRYEDAEAQFRSALNIWSTTLGEQHPDVAIARTTLANALVARGRDDEAEPELRAALAIVEKAGMPGVRVAVELSLGRLLARTDRPAEARELLQSAWRGLQHDAAAPIERARTALALAEVLWMQRLDLPDALELVLQAKAVFEGGGEPSRVEADAANRLLAQLEVGSYRAPRRRR